MRSPLTTILLLSAAASLSALPAGDEAAVENTEEKAPAIDPVSKLFLFPYARYFVTPDRFGIACEDVSFENRGGKKLRGWFFDRPESDLTVLVLNGNTGNISNALPYAKILMDAGIDVLLFDYQGFGKSEGVATALSLIGDAVRAFDFLAEEKGRPKEKIGVYGISLGSVLALAVGAQRRPAAVAVEDVFIPSDHVARYKESIAGDRVQTLLVQALERIVMPAIDPLATITKLEAPLFLIHGEDDWLLPPSGSIKLAKAAEAAGVTVRLWMMSGVGHAPESLEIDEREYARQVARFFKTTLEGKALAPLDASFEATEEDGGGFDVSVRVAGTAGERRPVEICLSDGVERFAFRRVWVEGAESTHRLRTEFRPAHASAIEHGSAADTKDGSWQPELSPLSRSLAAFRTFEADFDALRGSGFKFTEIPGFGQFLLREYGDKELDWLREHLPERDATHERIRPRFARIIARLQLGLPAKDHLRALPAAEMLLDWLPAELDEYYELGNAAFTLGFRDILVAESVWLLAGLRRHEGRLDEAKRLYGLYLDVLPTRATPRITREEIDRIGN